MDVQRITVAGTEMVMLTAADFDRLIDAREDAMDVRDGNAALVDMQVNGAMPGEVLDAILGGDSPIKAWRKYRGMTQYELGVAAKVHQGAIWRLEAAKPGAGRAETRKAIAEALGAPLWALEGLDSAS